MHKICVVVATYNFVVQIIIRLIIYSYVMFLSLNLSVSEYFDNIYIYVFPIHVDLVTSDISLASELGSSRRSLHCHLHQSEWGPTLTTTSHCKLVI